MSAVDEIQAAIDKLTKLKSESTQPTGGKSWIQGRNTVAYESDADVYTGDLSDDSSDIVTYIRPEDAALIVTLHATIDAQLAILREGLEQAEITVSPDEDDEIAIFLTLARSINGSAS